MPFSESVKNEARRKAHYRCVICHEPFVDVHHINPESESGDNTLDNAAPLCSGCHDRYGNNPDKKRQIRGMRDLWWDLCATRYAESNLLEKFELLDKLYIEFQASVEDQRRANALLEDIKKRISELHSVAKNDIASVSSFEQVVLKSGPYASATRLSENVYANFKCSNCGTVIGLMVGRSSCPTCGAPIR